RLAGKIAARPLSTLGYLAFVSPDLHKFSADHWVPDESAEECAAADCAVRFSVVNRRHHCRRCGQVYCGSHLSRQAQLLISDRSLDSDGLPTKVCEACFSELDRAAATAAGADAPAPAEASLSVTV
ncbi:hypothetical protein HK405_002071, partial [Cladochytrium tenue]